MAVVPAVLLVAVQILYPLTAGVARDRVIVAVVLLSAATAVTHAGRTRGVRWAVGVLVIVSGVGLLAEMVGTATGFPFGCYDYASGRIGPSVAGVPLVVALAWTGGLYPVWIVAGQLYSRTVMRVMMTAVGAVGWDLFLDPQMVADGQWTWCSPWPGLPGLPEIPLTNYLGWFAVGLVMAGLLAAWDRAEPKPQRARTSAPPPVSPPATTTDTPDSVCIPLNSPSDQRTASSQAARLSAPEPTTSPDAGNKGVAAPTSPATGQRTTESPATSAAGQRTTEPPATSAAAPDPAVSQFPGPRPDAAQVAAVRSGDVAVPVAVFLWTWLGSALAHAVFLGLPVSAGYGVVGLGVLGIPLVRALSARRITLRPVRHGTM
ncbi:carotenoid biosynthesis protein [Nocardia otitidiscaviarum]|uniref:carotenoid biosynthesis protein n=1 Tax=Nocardia otitidiscaviarum TaxID=1823 RepID=UPI001FD3D27B|nr:carotenoid biosynthesis protein [Nocardia otitidiscaviarum]MCP9619845.1 carotenoid biosynthesis protein [Nocardia otitidiscaviarum]